MAASDLCAELLKENQTLDQNMEKHICSGLMKQLDDVSIDVQGFLIFD
jgi:hypothetical protein